MSDATVKRRPVGRPRTRAGGETGYVGFRVPPELKARLTAEAARNGRSLSAETQVRLEKSFDREDIFRAALALALALAMTQGRASK